MYENVPKLTFFRQCERSSRLIIKIGTIASHVAGETTLRIPVSRRILVAYSSFCPGGDGSKEVCFLANDVFRYVNEPVRGHTLLNQAPKVLQLSGLFRLPILFSRAMLLFV